MCKIFFSCSQRSFVYSALLPVALDSCSPSHSLSISQRIKITLALHTDDCFLIFSVFPSSSDLMFFIYLVLEIAVAQHLLHLSDEHETGSQFTKKEWQKGDPKQPWEIGLNHVCCSALHMHSVSPLDNQSIVESDIKISILWSLFISRTWAVKPTEIVNK